MSKDTNSSPFLVQAPFDDPSSADIVLRSSDDIDFHVFKGVLIVASPVFRDMAATTQHLPVPMTSYVGKDFTKDGLPVVVMYESTAPVLDTLLRLLHPITPPSLDDLNIVSSVAYAAIKYDMIRAIEITKEALLKASLSASSATQAYMIASANGWKDIARKCAWETLKYPIKESDWTAKVENGMSLVHMWKLINYRKMVEAAILSFVIPEDLCADDFGSVNQCAINCSGDKCEPGSWVWLKWRSSMVVNVHRAPLAENVVSVSKLRDIASRASCPTCSKMIPPKAQRIVDAIKTRIRGTVDSICFDLS